MAFTSKKVFDADPAFIPAIADELVKQFRREGFSTAQMPLGPGGADVSITKGGLFKGVLGMKTALKITITPVGQQIVAEAGVGIFEQQAIPTMITVFIFWPVIITQIWGMIVQSRLDNRAMDYIELQKNPYREHSAHPAAKSRIEQSVVCLSGWSTHRRKLLCGQACRNRNFFCRPRHCKLPGSFFAQKTGGEEEANQAQNNT